MLIVTLAGPGRAERFNLPEGPGRALIYGHCQTCHDLQSVEDSAGIREGAWAAVIDNMEGFGLRVTDKQKKEIIAYLGTYMGPHPPKAPPPETTALAAPADGATVFGETCIACHQADGKGKGTEFPPLAGNTDLFLTPDFPAYVVLNGIKGKLTTEGRNFDNEMPAFDFLSDAEISAVIAYVRSNWGNDTLRPASMSDPTAADVAAIRAKPMPPEDVLKLRDQAKK